VLFFERTHYKNNLIPCGGYYYEESFSTSGSDSDDCWFDWLLGPSRWRKAKTKLFKLCRFVINISKFVIKLTGYTKKPSLTAGFFVYRGWKNVPVICRGFLPTACSAASLMRSETWAESFFRKWLYPILSSPLQTQRIQPGRNRTKPHSHAARRRHCVNGCCRVRIAYHFQSYPERL